MRLVLAAVAALLLAPATAAAQFDPIEGVWAIEGSSTGARNKIERQPDGSIKAVQITGSFTCTQREDGFLDIVGLVAYVVRPAGDGTYTGFGPLYDTSTCEATGDSNETKVVPIAPSATGQPRIRRCSGSPVQLDASGAPQGSTRCNVAVRVEAPQPPATAKQVTAGLPSARRCRSRRTFTIRLRNPRQDPLLSAEVVVNGRTVETRTGARTTAPVNLRGLPKGRYTVRISMVTATGRTLAETRRYRTCAGARR